MHGLARLAKKAVEAYVRDGEVLKPSGETSAGLAGETSGRAGVFVSLKREGQLRGCIGTIQPVTESIAEETVRNAIAAASEDPRFSPVEESELDELDYSVDVLGPAEEVPDASGLDPRRFGVIVSKGPRKGLLLPDLEGVDTVEEQLRIAMMKAGISQADKDVKIYRFEVNRYR